MGKVMALGRETKTKGKSQKLLTEVELELMNLLWSLREGTVNDVLECLPAGRKLAYTSVSTMLRILEQKKVVGSRKEGRGHVYFPLLSKEKYEITSLNYLVERVFGGTPSSLVRRLIDSSNLSKTEIDTLKKLLEEKVRS
jgi:predicted transcriptional regulator